LDTLQELGIAIERIVQDVPGSRSAFAERNVSGYYIDVQVDRAKAARYGLNTGDVNDVIMATAGGMNAAVSVQGRERYDVNVRYPRELRDHLEKLREIVTPTMSSSMSNASGSGEMAAPSMSGAQIPLGEIASVEAV